MTFFFLVTTIVAAVDVHSLNSVVGVVSLFFKIYYKLPIEYVFFLFSIIFGVVSAIVCIQTGKIVAKTSWDWLTFHIFFVSIFTACVYICSSSASFLFLHALFIFFTSFICLCAFWNEKQILYKMQMHKNMHSKACKCIGKKCVKRRCEGRRSSKVKKMYFCCCFIRGHIS